MCKHGSAFRLAISYLIALVSIACFFWALGARPAAAGDAHEWTKSDLPFGDIYALAADPQDGRVIWAASFGGGIYRSNDGGQTWREMSNGLSNVNVRALAVDGARRVYAGTYGGGVFVLRPGESSWSPLNAGLSTPYIYCLATDSQGNVYAGTGGEGVFSLAPGSASWVSRGPRGTQVLALAVCPSQEGTLYAGTWARGIFRSDDQGLSWQERNQGLENLNIRALVVHPLDKDIVYAGTWGGGVFRTMDGGMNWNELSTGLASNLLYALEVHISTEDFLYAGSRDGGVSKLIHGEVAWTPYGLVGHRIYSLLTVGSSAYFTLYAGAEDGIWMRKVSPSLLLHKTGYPEGIVYRGDTITYTLYYTNTGEIRLTNIVITDTIPQGATYAEGSAEASGGRYDPARNLVEWARGDLASGESGSVSFAVYIPTLPAPTPTASPTPSPSATPTGTETPTDTPTVTPTEAWSPSATPMETATPSPTDTPVSPTETPSPGTPSPTETVTPSPTLTPITLTETPISSPTCTSTATATPTAAVPPTASPTPTPICVQLLGNGNFETGTLDAWVALGATHIVTDVHHFGSYAVRMGGYDHAQDQLCQLVSIPQDVLFARLSYWWYMSTTQIAHPRDYLYLELYDAGGGFLASLDVVHDGHVAGRWSPSPSFDLTAFVGQRVWICFFCETNGSLPTTFYVDDINLQACVPGSATSQPRLQRGGKQQLPPSRRSARQLEAVPVYNVATIYSAQTGRMRSNGVWHSPRRLNLPLVLKP